MSPNMPQTHRFMGTKIRRDSSTWLYFIRGFKSTSNTFHILSARLRADERGRMDEGNI